MECQAIPIKNKGDGSIPPNGGCGSARPTRLGGTHKWLHYKDLDALDNNRKRAIMMEQGDKKMRNGKKVYKCQGLVIDLKDRERVILCQTDYDVFTPFSIGMDVIFQNKRVVANRWSKSHKGVTITREQVKSLFDGFAIKSICQSKKLRIVCS